MKLKNYSLILFLVILSQSAHAANWQQITKYDYIDLDSISNIEVEERSNIKSVWIQNYNDGSELYKNNISYINGRIFIDCTNKENATKGLWVYDKNNNIIQDNNIENRSLDWSSYLPGSKIDTISKYICKPEDLSQNRNSNINTKQSTATDIYNKHVNSMVYVKTNDSVGSGVIVQEDGTFITCFHVIENADYITIKTYDGRTFKVDGFKYINPTEDIAILTIDAPYTKFKPIDINYNQLQVGEKVYTISNPKGLEFTFSDGMINQYKNEYIQFSAPASPGSSGGALLNEKGQLIGIITAQYKEAQNINFAIPNDYYVSKINNLTIKNTYNQNWTKFLLSQTNSSQFKIKTDYSNIDPTSAETYYNRVKYYADLPNYPTYLYAVAGYIAYMTYIETGKQTALNDAIKWYELSVVYNKNTEVSIYALALLHAINNDEAKTDKYMNYLHEVYPESYQVFLKASNEIDLKARVSTYFEHLLKLTNEIRP